MRDARKIVSAIMVVIAISYIVISLWGYSGRKKEFFDDPDKIHHPAEQCTVIWRKALTISSF